MDIGSELPTVAGILFSTVTIDRLTVGAIVPEHMQIVDTGGHERIHGLPNLTLVVNIPGSAGQKLNEAKQHGAEGNSGAWHTSIADGYLATWTWQSKLDTLAPGKCGRPLIRQSLAHSTCSLVIHRTKRVNHAHSVVVGPCSDVGVQLPVSLAKPLCQLAPLGHFLLCIDRLRFVHFCPFERQLLKLANEFASFCINLLLLLRH